MVTSMWREKQGCYQKSAMMSPVHWRVRVINFGLLSCTDGDPAEAELRPPLAVLLPLGTMMLCCGLWPN